MLPGLLHPPEPRGSRAARTQGIVWFVLAYREDIPSW